MLSRSDGIFAKDAFLLIWELFNVRNVESIGWTVTCNCCNSECIMQLAISLSDGLSMYLCAVSSVKHKSKWLPRHMRISYMFGMFDSLNGDRLFGRWDIPRILCTWYFAIFGFDPNRTHLNQYPVSWLHPKPTYQIQLISNWNSQCSFVSKLRN